MPNEYDNQDTMRAETPSGSLVMVKAGGTLPSRAAGMEHRDVSRRMRATVTVHSDGEQQ
ncbi:hypothetical protein [Dickeya dadantii]|uniref:hypothetical protein n=1 Tax=Dickeya dadantii TaxID=204038 RepID=UPI0002F63422|nr:hypothetical protein [Dickeya dadantii]